MAGACCPRPIKAKPCGWRAGLPRLSRPMAAASAKPGLRPGLAPAGGRSPSPCASLDPPPPGSLPA